MITLGTTILLASLFGSLHCAGMCGPLVTLYVGKESGSAGHLAYNLGRWLSYAVLGGLAGAVGQALDRTVSLTGVQRVSAIVAAVLIVVWAVAPLLPAAWFRRSRTSGLGRVFARSLSALAKLPALPRATTVGVLSALLPCGWLYAFVAVAAGTGGWWQGMVVMTAFWLGSVPILVVTGYGAGSLIGYLRTRRPWVTAAILLTISGVTLFGRSELVGLELPASATDLEEAAERVEAAAEGEPPCCSDD